MNIDTTVASIRARLRAHRDAGARVALVPTMGALHAGHMALVTAAREHADVVVVSIFVNPLQFGESEDLARYPRSLDADCAALAARGVDIVFAPSSDEMYSSGVDDRTLVLPRPFGETFEGAVRPAHFTGVLTVVTKLFNIIQPGVAVFGQKDLQQLSLVRAMVSDLDLNVAILGVPTQRETDGLAMSSRNLYLSERDRIRATQLYSALSASRAEFAGGELRPDRIVRAGKGVLERDPDLVVDYFSVVEPVLFASPDSVAPGNAVILAARLGATRLIDNVIL